MGRKRKNYRTTKQTHFKRVQQKVTNQNDLLQIVEKTLTNNNGRNFGVCIKLSHYKMGDGYFTHSWVVNKDKWIEDFRSDGGFNCYQNQMQQIIQILSKSNDKREVNFDYTVRTMMWKLFEDEVNKNNYSSDNVVDTDFVEIMLKLATELVYSKSKDEIENDYNSWFLMDFKLLYADEENTRIVIEVERISNYDKFLKLMSRDMSDDATIETLEEVEEEVKEERPEITVDDIQIVDNGVKPILGLSIQVLEKLKNAMSVLQVGQTIKMKSDVNLRNVVYKYNALYFPDKKFSVYDGGDCMVVFLNDKKQ